MPMIRRSPRDLSAVTAIMPACVEPVTVHTMTVSKNTPSWRSCSATSRIQFANPRPPSGWSDAPAGIGYGVPPASITESRARCQLSQTPMSTPDYSMRVSPTIIRVNWMMPTIS